MTLAYFSYKNAYAIFYDDYIFSFIAGIINVASSVLLCFKFGLIGVYLGTLLTQLFLLYIKSSVSFKMITNNSKVQYLYILIKYYIVFSLFLFLLKYIFDSYVVVDSFITIAIHMIIVFIIYVIYFIMIFYNNEYFKYIIKIACNLFVDIIIHIRNRLHSS